MSAIVLLCPDIWQCNMLLSDEYCTFSSITKHCSSTLAAPVLVIISKHCSGCECVMNSN